MSEILIYLVVIVGLLGAAWYFWQGVKRDKQRAYATTEGYSYPYQDEPVGNSSPQPYATGETYTGKVMGNTGRLQASRDKSKVYKERYGSTDDYDDSPLASGTGLAVGYATGLATAESGGSVRNPGERSFNEVSRPDPGYPTEMVQSVRESDSYSIPTPQQASDSLADTLQRSSHVFSTGGQSDWSGGGYGDLGRESAGSAGGGSGFDNSPSRSYEPTPSYTPSTPSSYESSSPSSSDSGSTSPASSD